MIEGTVDVFSKFYDSKMENVHTCIPGIIESYDGHATRKATVKPAIKLNRENGDNIEILPITNVPVIFPSSTAFNMVYPLQQGDSCLILFSETGIGTYLDSSGSVVDSDDYARFSLTDAICLPGLFPFGQVPATKTIELDEEGVLKFFEGTESFVLGDVLKTEIQKNIDALTQLQTDFTSWIPVATDGGAALKLILESGFLLSALASLDNILSAKIKGL